MKTNTITEDYIPYKRCFVCGAENPIGLHIEKFVMEEEVCCLFQVGENNCGYPGILHGGITAAIADELMGDAANLELALAVTVSISVKYESPGFVGETLLCKGWVVRREEGHAWTRAVLTNQQSGRTVAVAEGEYFKISPERLSKNSFSL